MERADILPLLLYGQTVSLASWFAEPLSGSQADAWLPRIQRRTQAAIVDGRDAFMIRLTDLIVQYWRGQEIEAGHKNLLTLAVTPRDRAMLELVVGQLLIARKSGRAWRHLDAVFEQAAHLLEPEEYFQVLKRHELLRLLPLSPNRVTPAGLDELLTEAKVIGRLKGRGTRSRPAGPKHQDTND